MIHSFKFFIELGILKTLLMKCAHLTKITCCSFRNRSSGPRGNSPHHAAHQCRASECRMARSGHVAVIADAETFVSVFEQASARLSCSLR